MRLVTETSHASATMRQMTLFDVTLLNDPSAVDEAGDTDALPEPVGVEPVGVEPVGVEPVGVEPVPWGGTRWGGTRRGARGTRSRGSRERSASQDVRSTMGLWPHRGFAPGPPRPRSAAQDDRLARRSAHDQVQPPVQRRRQRATRPGQRVERPLRTRRRTPPPCDGSPTKRPAGVRARITRGRSASRTACASFPNGSSTPCSCTNWRT